MSPLKLAMMFLAFAVIAGLFGFGIVSETPSLGGKVFCFLFLGIAVIICVRVALYRPAA